MLYNICYLFLMFLVYSVIGYLVEVCFCSYHSKKLVLNRGFLIGPCLPIYGTSVVLMYIFLYKYKNDVMALFIMSCFICSVMEYFTSLIMEKIFKVRWWDYSKQKFNVDGRICLLNSVLFGLGGVAIFYLLNPLILPDFDMMSKKTLIIVTIVLMAIFLADFITSIVVLIQLKVSSRNFAKKDVSEEVIKLRNETLRKQSFLLKRLLNAFPKIEGHDKERVIELKNKVNEIRELMKETRKERKHNKKYD